MAVFIALTFGKVFYLGAAALPWFFGCLFFLGFGGANFAVYTLWLPEQYPTECRASAFAFSTSVARFGGAGITFLVGAGVQHFQSLGIPVALTSIAFAIGLLLLPFGVETRGQTLPSKPCRKGTANMAEAETKLFPVEAVPDFTTHSILHSAVP